MEFRKLKFQIFDDPAIRKLSFSAQGLFLAMIALPSIGLSGFGCNYFLQKTNCESKLILELLDDINRVGIIMLDPTNQIFWIKNLLRHQGETPYAIRIAWNHAQKFRKSCLYPEFIKRYPSIQRQFQSEILGLNNQIVMPEIVNENILSLMKQWNEFATVNNLVQFLLDERNIRWLSKTVTVKEAEQMPKLLDEIKHSEFLLGRIGRWNGATIFWLFREHNFSRVLSGEFRDKAKKNSEHEIDKMLGLVV